MSRPPLPIVSLKHVRWTAICQGAVCKGFLDNPRESAENEFDKPIEITSTVCRASFGVSFTTQFIPGKHHPDDKVWYELEGLYGAANQLRWYLKKVGFMFLTMIRCLNPDLHATTAGRFHFEDPPSQPSILCA